MFKISIDFDTAQKGLSNTISKDILLHTLKSEKIESGEIAIIFGNKRLLRKLKKEYFNIDRNTDVIAFRLNDYKDKNIEGEIYICLPVAKENAKLFGEPFKKEIARLIIHGGLHLIGYDDNTKNNRLKMKDLEDKYLKELKID